MSKPSFLSLSVFEFIQIFELYMNSFTLLCEQLIERSPC